MNMFTTITKFCIAAVTFALCFACSVQEKDDPFTYKIGIVGNPTDPDIRYDEAQVSALRNMGINTLQLNIAWGSRPGDEPLNLEDILYREGQGVGDKAAVDKRLENIKMRARVAKANGFRTLFHFGAPCVGYPLYKKLGSSESIDAMTEEHSILKPEVVNKYVELLKQLKKEVPELDDIQVYTFDQEAWLGSEFGKSPSERDIPLHERVPGFLKKLTETWAEVSPRGMMWWEPWELSAGQIYAIIPELPTKNFGLFLHSNIAEVQLTRPVCVWFKNTVRLLHHRGIPAVGEVFMCSANEELQSLQYLAAPRLVGEQIDAIANVPFISGIKEYYGFNPDRYDPSQMMAGLKFTQPGISTEEALKELAQPYGDAAGDIMAAWEATSMGISLIPWDLSWRIRQLMVNTAGLRVYHQWDIAHLAGVVAPSPSWKSTRRSLFMLTEEEVVSPWLFEDVELRFKNSSEELAKAIAAFEKAGPAMSGREPYASYIANSLEDARKLEQLTTALRCYCRESNLAWLMRQYTADNEPIPQALTDRFVLIMQTDIANQAKGYEKNVNGQPTAEEMLVLFRRDPVKWVSDYLIFR